MTISIVDVIISIVDVIISIKSLSNLPGHAAKLVLEEIERNLGTLP